MAGDDAEGDEGFDSLLAGSTDSAATEAYYDDWAETYDATLNEWAYRTPTEVATVLAGHLAPGARVLDVGCGTGLFAAALSARWDGIIDGIDISAASLEIAGAKGLYGQLMRHDLQATPLPLDTDGFDAAACVGVLTYIEDAPALLAELCRIVRPGGVLAFTQRDDRWAAAGFDGLLADFTARGLWSAPKVGAARAYLPGNDDFADKVRVIPVLCRVR